MSLVHGRPKSIRFGTQHTEIYVDRDTQQVYINGQPVLCRSFTINTAVNEPVLVSLELYVNDVRYGQGPPPLPGSVNVTAFGSSELVSIPGELTPEAVERYTRRGQPVPDVPDTLKLRGRKR